VAGDARCTRQDQHRCGSGHIRVDRELLICIVHEHDEDAGHRARASTFMTNPSKRNDR
jgi:hypothetical protein